MNPVILENGETKVEKKSRKFLGLIIVFGTLLFTFILSFLVTISPDLLDVFFKSIVFSFVGFVTGNAGITAAAVAITKNNKIPKSTRWGNKFAGLIIAILVLLTSMLIFRFVNVLDINYYVSISKWLVYGYLAYVTGNTGISISAMMTNRLGN